MRIAVLLVALILWPPIAGAVTLFFINGLGSSGAFTEPAETAMRSLTLSAREGFEFGVRAMPFLSLTPAAAVFAARRWRPALRDVNAGLLGALLVCAVFIVWIMIDPLDPLVAGIVPLVMIVLLISGAITAALVGRLRPRATPATPAP